MSNRYILIYKNSLYRVESRYKKAYGNAETMANGCTKVPVLLIF